MNASFVPTAAWLRRRCDTFQDISEITAYTRCQPPHGCGVVVTSVIRLCANCKRKCANRRMAAASL